MAKFLSDEWIVQAKKIQEEATDLGEPAIKVKLNLDVTLVPEEISSENMQAHLDTSDGGLDLDLGHLDDPELAIQLDYVTAKAILINGDGQAGVSAFMAGKLKLQKGDLAKLMAIAQGISDVVSPEVADALKAITD